MIGVSYLLYLALFGSVLILKQRRGQLNDLVPSGIWLVFMVLPFWLQRSCFAAAFVDAQAWGILLIAVALLAGDAALYPSSNGVIPAGIEKKPSTKIWLWTLSFAAIGLQVAHILTMPSVPLLDKYLGKANHPPEVEKAIAVVEPYYQRQTDLSKALRGAANRNDAMKIVVSYTEFLTTEEKNGFPAIHTAGVQLLHFLERSEASVHEQEHGIPSPSAAVSKEIEYTLSQFRGLKSSERQYWQEQLKDSDGTPKQWAKSLLEDQTSQKAIFRQALDSAISFELGYLRERSSKLLKVSSAFIYACQATVTLMPILCFCWFTLGHRLVALSLLMLTLFYSRVTLAKQPLYLLLILSGVLLLTSLPKRVRKGMVIAGLAVFIPLGSFGVWFLATNPLSILKYRIPEAAIARNQGYVENPKARETLAFTITDHFRRLTEFRDFPEYQKVKPLNDAQGFVNFLAYRAFLAPVDVSHRWYAYFPEVHGGYLGWYGLTPASRHSPGFRHPANLVGQWAFYNRFPSHYLPSLSAYCSVDADAYARWGLRGVAIISLLLFGLRLGMALVREDTIIDRGIYLCGLVLLGLSLPQASLQATLIAQGWGILLVIMAVRLLMSNRFRETLLSWRRLTPAAHSAS